MSVERIPDWMTGLEDEDVAFIRNFILASGSLKQIASEYGVTYPTVRLRLDRLIQKIHISEENAGEPYIALIKRLALSEKLDFDTAKLLIHEYKKITKEGNVHGDDKFFSVVFSDCTAAGPNSLRGGGAVDGEETL